MENKILQDNARFIQSQIWGKLLKVWAVEFCVVNIVLCILGSFTKHLSKVSVSFVIYARTFVLP